MHRSEAHTVWAKSSIAELIETIDHRRASRDETGAHDRAKHAPSSPLELQNEFWKTNFELATI